MHPQLKNLFEVEIPNYCKLVAAQVPAPQAARIAFSEVGDELFAETPVEDLLQRYELSDCCGTAIFYADDLPYCNCCHQRCLINYF